MFERAVDQQRRLLLHPLDHGVRHAVVGLRAGLSAGDAVLVVHVLLGRPAQVREARASQKRCGCCESLWGEGVKERTLLDDVLGGRHFISAGVHRRLLTLSLGGVFFLLKRVTWTAQLGPLVRRLKL